MMKAKRIKTWLMGLTVAAAIALQGMTALAEESVPGNTRSITIVPSFTNDKSEATPIEDSASFDIYKVGKVKPGTSVTEFDLTGGDFAGFDEVKITKKTMEDKAAKLPIALAKYAANPDHIKSPVWTTVSNKPVTEVPDGLYLAVQTTHFAHYYDVLPFLIIMPEGSETGYKYEVEAMPKTTKRTPVKLDPPVRKLITDQYGNSITSDEKFEFVMTPSAGAPMPEGTATGTPKTATAGAGGVEFGEISYSTVGGPYVYTFTEKAGSNARWTYDDSVYTMTVNVIRNAEDKLEAQKTITKNGAEVSIVEFKNSYRKRSSGGGGGSSSGGGPGGNPSTDPNGPTGKPTVEPTVEPEGGVGRVLGAVRDKLADTPVGRVLGASRRAKTGDDSSMRTYGAVFGGAVVLLAAWGVTYKKKKRHTNEA